MNQPSNERFASVWDAIEDTPAQAENMKLRSALMRALKDRIVIDNLSQSQAAKLFGVTQPRISDLVRGKIELFGLDTLVNMVAAAGLHVEMRVLDAAEGRLSPGEWHLVICSDDRALLLRLARFPGPRSATDHQRGAWDQPNSCTT